jgi:hypothetical protein
MKNCFVRKFKVVVDNSNLPVVKEKTVLYDTTISIGTNFNISLPVGTEVVVEVTNNSEQQEYLMATQRDSNNQRIATIISGMALAAGAKKTATTQIVEGCEAFNITVDTGRSNDIRIYYEKPI